MKYLLSEQEYRSLTEQHTYSIKLANDKLQKLCTKIANEMPVDWEWGNSGDHKDPEPWGCILTKDYEWYCDTCPVQEICPNKSKHWSK